MIEVIQYSKSKVKHSSLKKFNSGKSSYLIDVQDPNLDDLERISKVTGITLVDLKSSLDIEEVPRVETREKYTIIIFRDPYIKEKDYTVPLGIYLGKNFILTLHKKEIISLSKMLKDLNVDLFKRGSGYVFHDILSGILRQYTKTIEEIEEDIDEIEDRALRNDNFDLLNNIFKHKKTLIYYRKYLTRNRDVIDLIEKDFSPFVKNKKLFNNLFIEISQIIDTLELIKERITSLIEVHISSISNKLNEVMKYFTVIASLLLLPTLISGIYGMNFRVIPLSQDQYGFWYLIGIMIVSMIIMLILFRWKKWI